MSSLLSPIARLACGCALLFLASCSSTSWPRPVKITSRPGQSAYPMRLAMESAQNAAAAGMNEEALAGWLRTAQEAALLIEDKTTCGDGSISRIKVTRVYQYALGRILPALQPRSPSRSTLHVAGPQGRWQLTMPADTTFTLAPAKRAYGSFRVGIPLLVKFTGEVSHSESRTAMLYFEKPATERSEGRVDLRLMPAGGNQATKLHPNGPDIPLREARLP